ncbi:unnamed protein product [Symbiodinium natans]|uniref:Uncharacterized protein n=1 Tax=Symbiodinium natans TaxID=878477 RepID=A0A812Q5Z8_9DINO|nr:unnamed protein product [Symbiodinium natans]
MADGSVVTWGDQNHYDSHSPAVAENLTSVDAIYSTCAAFAAKKMDGTVATWGNSQFGGDSSSVSEYLSSVDVIYSTEYAFAAKKTDGTVVTWGDPKCGGDSSSVAEHLSSVDVIYSASCAFAAKKTNGTVVTWGDRFGGGDSSSVADRLSSVEVIYSTSRAFAAKRKDGTVVTWGHSLWGGDSSPVVEQLRSIVAIYSTEAGAFAAQKVDGTVVTWGDPALGGDSSSVAERLSSVDVIYSTRTAFAAKKRDGTVVTWGKPKKGGDSSSVVQNLSSVDVIYSSCCAFAAKRIDGTVVTWGLPGAGGDSSSVAGRLSSVDAISSTSGAFAAKRTDGTVVTWGNALSGGDSSSVAEHLTSVDVIYSTHWAFAAKKKDGTVVTWGVPRYGGDSSSVQRFVNQLPKPNAERSGGHAVAKRAPAVAGLSGGGEDSALGTDLHKTTSSPAPINKSLGRETWLLFAAVAAFCTAFCFSPHWFRNAVRYRRRGARDMTVELMSTSAYACDTVPALAACYNRRVLEDARRNGGLKEENPILVAGYSHGCVVAHQMACQLEEDGISVGVILFDLEVTWPPPATNSRVGGYSFLGGEAEAILLISRAFGKFEFAMKEAVELNLAKEASQSRIDVDALRQRAFEALPYELFAHIAHGSAAGGSLMSNLMTLLLRPRAFAGPALMVVAPDSPEPLGEMGSERDEGLGFRVWGIGEDARFASAREINAKYCKQMEAVYDMYELLLQSRSVQSSLQSPARP